MKMKGYILGALFFIGLSIGAKAQNDSNLPEDYQFKANTNNNSEVAGESRTLFTIKDQKKSAKTGCSLIQNKWKERQIYYKKNGYTIITSGKDEIIEVKKKKSGVTKVSYMNDFETLDYKVSKSGKTFYKYSYTNGCVKIFSKKNKLGTSNTNKSDLSTKEINENIQNAIQFSANSCMTL